MKACIWCNSSMNNRFEIRSVWPTKQDISSEVSCFYVYTIIEIPKNIVILADIGNYWRGKQLRQKRKAKNICFYAKYICHYEK